MSYELDIGLLLIKMRQHFFDINKDKDLTEADKKQLKEFYLQNFIAPKARKLLGSTFPKNSPDPRHPNQHQKPTPTKTANPVWFQFDEDRIVARTSAIRGVDAPLRGRCVSPRRGRCVKSTSVIS